VGGGGAPTVVSRCVETQSLVVGKTPASEDVKPCNTKAQGATALEAVTRQLVKTQQTGKT
jgi:hypothetical protein